MNSHSNNRLSQKASWPKKPFVCVAVILAPLLLIVLGCSPKQPQAQQQPETTQQKTKSQTTSFGPATDWPMERGNVNSTGSSDSKIGDAFEIAWEFKYPKGAFESSPIIVTQNDKPTVFVAGVDVNVKGKLFSIDLESGDVNWEHEVEEGFVSSPAWHDNRIFVGDMYGKIYCLDASTGDEQWTFEAKGEISSGANFYESLVLFGSQDATLYALDQKTGKLQWSHAVDDQIQCGATVAGDRCFLAGCDSKLHVISLTEEKEVGSLEIVSPTGSTAAVIGDDVFFGTEQGTFYSIKFEEPSINWQWEDAAGVSSIRGSAAVSQDAVVFGARNRKINCLNPADGELLWSTKVKAKVDGSAIIAGDRVYVGSTDGRFYVLDLADGNILWQKQFNGSIYGSAGIYAGSMTDGTQTRLVLATERGTVYCLKPIE